MFRTPMAGNRFILGTGKSNQKTGVSHAEIERSLKCRRSYYYVLLPYF